MQKQEDQTVRIARKIERSAAVLNSEALKIAAVDLAEVRRAASVVTEAVDKLAADVPLSRAEAAQILTEISAWLFDELQDHMTSLQGRLNAAAEELYRD